MQRRSFDHTVAWQSSRPSPSGALFPVIRGCIEILRHFADDIGRVSGTPGQYCGCNRGIVPLATGHRPANDLALGYPAEELVRSRVRIELWACVKEIAQLGLCHSDLIISLAKQTQESSA
jgi:hypothetical protein